MSADHGRTVEMRLRAAVESSPAGLLMVDRGGRIVLLNAEVERLFGYSREELLGRNVEVLIPERFRGSHPAQRASFFEDPRVRAMGAGRDLYGLRKDGSEVPLEIGLTPVATDEGMFVLSSVVDIGDRKRAEARFRIAVESSPNGMVMIDGSGQIVMVNREMERMFGYSRQTLLGEPIELLVPERFREAHSEHRQKYCGSPVTRAMGAGRDLYGLRADGSEFPVEIGLNPVESDDQVFILGSVVDITARKQAERERRHLEEQLRQAQKMEAVGTLAGGIAHDFNNILGAIIGYAELARDSLPEQAQARVDLGELLKSADRGRQLIQRILTVSRRQEPIRRPVAMGSVIGEASGLLRATLPTPIEIEVAIDPDAPRVLADPTSIQQVVMNLGNNAAQAMPGGGKLRIAAEPFYVCDSFARAHPELHEGPHCLLTVQDEGHGMEPWVRERALEPFFTTKRPGEGTGLGLSMVQAIMRDHDGIVVIDSEVGRGTVVRCVFPAIDAEVPEQQQLTAGTPRGGGERVLYVDDEPALAELGNRRLTSLGYSVVALTDSVKALDAFRGAPDQFDVVITDYYMPRMTGLALARQISSIRPGIAIVMMTGLIGDLDVEVLAASGVRKTVVKPTTMQQLAEAVREVLAPRR